MKLRERIDAVLEHKSTLVTALALLSICALGTLRVVVLVVVVVRRARTSPAPAHRRARVATAIVLRTHIALKHGYYKEITGLVELENVRRRMLPSTQYTHPPCVTRRALRVVVRQSSCVRVGSAS